MRPNDKKPRFLRALLALTPAFFLLAPGCVLESGGLFGLDGGASGTDGGPPGMDAGPGVDAGPGCGAANEQCEGDRFRVLCEGGDLVRSDCDMDGRICVHSPGERPSCEPKVCEPDSTACTPDGSSLLECNSIGTAAVETFCDRGCVDASGCRGETFCLTEVDATLNAPGSLIVNTCSGINHASTGCGTVGGSDRIIRLNVSIGGRFQIDLVKGGSQIDPVLYVRRRCADPSSEISCDDDSGSNQNSRLTLDLRAGDYFVFADSYLNSAARPEGDCGEMTLTVTRL